MDKAQTRRGDLAQRIADHLLSEGLAGATLRPLARAAGLSDRMLIYYFGSRDAAIAAGLACAANRLKADLLAASAPQRVPAVELEGRLTRFVLAPEQQPVMTLWLEIAARAARGDTPYTQIAPVIAQGFLDWVAAQLDLSEPDRSAEALGLLARLDGLFLLKGAGLNLSKLQARSAS